MPPARQSVPPQQQYRRHGGGPAAPDPLASSITGSLPVPGPEYAASQGELPIGAPAAETAEPQPAGSNEPTVRRTKVSLTAPKTEPEREREDDEARVYVAPPPPDGLGKFDLGSVPASVTPPPTWRKAAWFASLASGGVVVSLLVAGSVLVSQPQEDQQAIQGWPDRHGGAPMLPGEYDLDGTVPPSTDATESPTSTAAGSEPTTTPAPGTNPGNVADRLSSGRPSGSAPAGGPGSGTSGTDAPSSPTATREPQKPPVTPASMSTSKRRYLVRSHDPKTMGQRSQDYLNTVTEDPETAHSMTTGELAEGGSDGLRRKYAGIAYFVVKHVYIDQNEGFTVNTVEVTHKNGNTTEETRKLYFGDGTKIEKDAK